MSMVCRPGVSPGRVSMRTAIYITQIWPVSLFSFVAIVVNCLIKL